MNQSPLIGIVILAAGNSSRLGEPKQLLQFQNKSLLRHVVVHALETSSIVIVITGFHENSLKEELDDLPVYFAHNENWETGMASSIRVGVDELLKINPAIEGVILAVSDQPFVSSQLFLDLITESASTQKSIVACSYEDTVGTPVLFLREHFDSIQSLQGQEGAKKLLKKFNEQVSTIPFPLGSIDIDTKEDFTNLLNRQ